MLKIRTILAPLALSALLASPAGFAQFYQWIDDQDRIQLGDGPPDGAALEQTSGKISSFAPATIEPSESGDKLVTAAIQAPSVVMYSASWCRYCRQAAQYFRKHGIPFKEYDIQKSAKGLRDYKKLNGRGVPIILVGKRRMDGFDARTFDELYFGKS